MVGTAAAESQELVSTRIDFVGMNADHLPNHVASDGGCRRSAACILSGGFRAMPSVVHHRPRSMRAPRVRGPRLGHTGGT